MKRILTILSIVTIFIISDSVYAYNSYNIGDQVKYKGSNYYVIKNSSENDNYLTLVRDSVLSIDEIRPYANSIYSMAGYANVMYAKCSFEEFNNGSSNCTTDYNTSYIKELLEQWASDTFVDDELVEIDGLKVRVLNTDDLVGQLGFEYNENEEKYEYRNNNYNAVLKDNSGINDVDSYFINDLNKVLSGNQYQPLLYFIERKEAFNQSNISFVKPVINLKKEALGESINNDTTSSDPENSNEQKNDKVCRMEKQSVPIFHEYHIGDIITYKGEKYIVVADSKTKDNYVTLLKINALTSDDISKYSDVSNNDDQIAAVSFKESTSGKYCYNESLVKNIIEEWVNVKFDSNEVYSSGLLNSDYIMQGWYQNTFGYNEWNGEGYRCDYSGWCTWHSGDPYLPEVSVPKWFKDYVLYVHSDVTPDWLYNAEYDYWIDSYEWCDSDYSSGHMMISRSGDAATIVGRQAAIRPVITVYQTALGVDNNYEFQFGEEVTYKGVGFKVVDISGTTSGDWLVTLLKDLPFTIGELKEYNNESQPGDMVAYNSYCSYYQECTSDYKTSNLKTIVDRWTSDKFRDEELVEVDGYKSRVISVDELKNNLGYEYHDVITETILEYTEDTPTEIYSSGELYWTMSRFEDDTIIGPNSDNSDNIYIYSKKAIEATAYSKNKVRPVVNLYKCVLEDGCDYEEVEVEVCYDEVDSDNDGNADNPLTVLVENTLNSPAFILVVASLVLILTGSVIFLKAKIQSKKINKI